jgi:hypothetical protein
MTPDSTLTGDRDLKPSKGARLHATSVKDYTIGGLDQRGREVLDILWSTKEFVIYQHEKGISPHFSDDDNIRKYQQKRYLSLGPALSRVNASLPPPFSQVTHPAASREDNQGNSKDSGKGTAGKAHPVRRSWSFFHTSDGFLVRETARAIANALAGEVQDAFQILEFVEARLIARRRAQGQFKYLLGCTGMLALITVIACVIVKFWLSPSEAAWADVVWIATCGAVGGFLSVAIGIRKLDVDPDTADWVHAFYGLIRLTIAVLSAVVVYLLIKSKLAFEPLFSEDKSRNSYILYSLAVVAGFFESFVPNILRRSRERGGYALDEDLLPPKSQIDAAEQRVHTSDASPVSSEHAGREQYRG